MKTKYLILVIMSSWQKKSFGHALGPIAILYRLGFAQDSMEFKNVFNFFKYFLIAKQLNDDAHDWKIDLERGFINPVGKEVLMKSKNKKEYQDVFWNEVIVKIAEVILDNVQKAKKCLPNVLLIEEPELMLAILKKPESSAREVLEEHQKAVEFMGEYKGEDL